MRKGTAGCLKRACDWHEGRRAMLAAALQVEGDEGNAARPTPASFMRLCACSEHRNHDQKSNFAPVRVGQVPAEGWPWKR